MKINRIKLKAKIDNIFGICCYHLLPIEQEYHMGKGKIIAICTLASLDLLKEIKNNNEIMEKISIVGRLLSENKGIDEIIKFTKKNTLLKYILVCGEDVKGHSPGQTLISSIPLFSESNRPTIDIFSMISLLSLISLSKCRLASVQIAIIFPFPI